MESDEDIRFRFSVLYETLVGAMSTPKALIGQVAGLPEVDRPVGVRRIGRIVFNHYRVHGRSFRWRPFDGGIGTFELRLAPRNRHYLTSCLVIDPSVTM